MEAGAQAEAGGVSEAVTETDAPNAFPSGSRSFRGLEPRERASRMRRAPACECTGWKSHTGPEVARSRAVLAPGMAPPPPHNGTSARDANGTTVCITHGGAGEGVT
ncbi:MAG: hypothetical protein SangKO_020950 [Sandaracinaceae bacterium]